MRIKVYNDETNNTELLVQQKVTTDPVATVIARHMHIIRQLVASMKTIDRNSIIVSDNQVRITIICNEDDIDKEYRLLQNKFDKTEFKIKSEYINKYGIAYISMDCSGKGLDSYSSDGTIEGTMSEYLDEGRLHPSDPNKKITIKKHPIPPRETGYRGGNKKLASSRIFV